jgi:hypothetical protein
MRHRISGLILVLVSAAGVASADSPRLLLDRSQIGTLRERIARPTLALVWAGILADAEAHCSRKSRRYAEPANPCPLSQDRGRMTQQRHDAPIGHGRNDRAVAQGVGGLQFE